MAGVAYLASTCSHGAGPILTTTVNVFVNGKPIAVLLDPASAPCGLFDPVTHPLGANPIATKASATVFAGGKPVHRIGDLRICGATTNSGSADVNAG